MPRNPLHAQIQIAKNQLGLEDDDYRATLQRAIGKRSSSGITDAERKKVLVEMRRLGFQATSGGDNQRNRPMSKKPYVRLIFALWGELKREGIWREQTRASLIRFIKERTDCDDPEWLSYAEASKVIEALKAMKKRAI